MVLAVGMRELQNLSDEELLGLVRATDEDALVALYRRHQGALFRFALQMSGSRTTAEDVTQEIFLSLVRGPIGFDAARGTAKAYLFGIARHILRRQGPHPVGAVPLGDASERAADMAASAIPTPLDELDRRETVAAVRQAIAALPVHYREVVVLCELEEMNYVDAAALLACPVGTVRSRLHRARGLLIKKLTMEPEDQTAGALLRAARCLR
jgi:RNA polymerase sigma-70 factor (ECF subfamily)